MQTPTLIVRLGGLYLLASCSIGLIQLHKVQAIAAQFRMGQQQLSGDISVYLWIGLVIGLAATAFAGPLARILTFDAAAREPSVDLTERLLGRK